MTRSSRALALVVLGLTAGTAACRKAIDPVTPQPDVVPAASSGSPIDSAAIRDSIARARQAEEDARRAAEEAANAGPDRERRLAELRSEEHTSELQSRLHLVCRLLLEKKKNNLDKN